MIKQTFLLLVSLLVFDAVAFSQGEPHFTYPRSAGPDSVTKWEDISVNDRFFKTVVYEQLAKGADAAITDASGKVLSRSDIAVKALAWLEHHAAKVVKSKQISQAMFAGKFNPHPEDIQLAFEGLVPDGSLAEGVTASGYNFARKRLWNERFGSLLSMATVNTLISGKERKLSSMDLGMLTVQRTQPRFMREAYGVGLSPNATFEEAKAELGMQGGPQYVAALKTEITAVLKHTTVYIHFFTKCASSDFNFRQDYQDLREKLYLPSLKKAHFAKLRATASPAEEGKK